MAVFRSVDDDECDLCQASTGLRGEASKMIDHHGVHLLEGMVSTLIVLWMECDLRRESD